MTKDNFRLDLLFFADYQTGEEDLPIWIAHAIPSRLNVEITEGFDCPLAYLMLGFKVPLEVFFVMNKYYANIYQRLSHLVEPRARDSCQQKRKGSKCNP